LTETWSLLEAILPTGITVEATMDGERFVVNGDPGRLQQALMNLAINARDAMSDGGRLEFRLATFDLRPEEPSPYRDMSPGEWIRLEVTDTGVGIAPDVLPRIFEPFFTTKGDGKGTGLGLAQVYGIVKRHDGYVEVRSHLGAGTTFTMYLPADDRQPHRGPDVLVTDTGNHEGATVLVIEDDEGTRPALSQVLEIKGYSVLSAATGTQASDILERHEGNVDIVLCDVHLPDADGQDLSLRLGRRWKRPRFVLMSGYSLGLATREAVSDARYRWLSKPFTIAELTAALRAPSN
jgi:CheY-like chemotaxis protein